MITIDFWRTGETRNLLFEALAKTNELIVFDTETTGFDAKKNNIIQISGIKLKIEDDYTFTEIDRLNTYINPGYSIPPKITEITGISDGDLINQPSEDEIFEKIFNFFLGIQAVAGQNADFDMRFVKAMYERQGKTFNPTYVLDTLKMAKDLISKDETPNYKLGTIANLYGVDKDLTFHNSMDDVIATTRLLSVFCYEYQKKQEEEEAKILSGNITPKKIPKVSTMHYWEGPRGLKRIYIHTNLGAFYYDIRYKTWNKKPDNVYELDEVDMEELRKSAFEIAGVNTEEDFAHYRD